MSNTKKLRACLLCSFVATPAEFRKQGCPNCEDKLEVCGPRSHSRLEPRCADRLGEQMRGDADQVMNCTTAQFDGVVAMIRPDESWVVREPPFFLFLTLDTSTMTDVTPPSPPPPGEMAAQR